MGNSNCNSSLDPVGLEADQFHVAEDVLNLLVESSRGLLSLANASTCDLINLIDNCLATVPEYLPLVELLLPLCLLLGTDLLFLLNLLPAFVCALFKARQHCMQFLHHSLLPLSPNNGNEYMSLRRRDERDMGRKSPLPSLPLFASLFFHTPRFKE